jgi:hypothetical protein
MCLLLAVATSCGSGKAAVHRAEKYLAILNDNQAKVLLTIGGKEFYPTESVFTCQLLASRDILSMTLTDQFDGRTMINITDKKLYGVPKHVRIEADGKGATSLKIGKLVDRARLIGEGYMMTHGTISIITLDKEKVIFEIKGEVGPYSDFQAPDKLLPLDGIVVCKRPAISFGDITEKEVFGSTHSN